MFSNVQSINYFFLISVTISNFFGAFLSGVEMLHFLLDLWALGLQESVFEGRLPDFVEEIIPELKIATLLDKLDTVSGYALFAIFFHIIELEEFDLDVEVAVLFILLGR